MAYSCAISGQVRVRLRARVRAGPLSRRPSWARVRARVRALIRAWGQGELLLVNNLVRGVDAVSRCPQVLERLLDALLLEQIHPCHYTLLRVELGRAFRLMSVLLPGREVLRVSQPRDELLRQRLNSPEPLRLLRCGPPPPRPRGGGG